MTFLDLAVYLLKFYIPAVFSLLFRAYGLGYTTKRRLAWGFTVYTLYVMVVPGVLILLMGYGAYTHISALVMTTGSMAVLIFSTDPPAKTIFLHLVQGSMVTALSVVLNLARTLLGMSYLALLAVLAVSCPVLYLIALRYWAKPLRFIADHLHDGLASLMALPLLTMGMVNLIPVFPPQNFANHPLYCSCMMLGLELVLFLYIITLYRSLWKISLLTKEELKSELLQAEISTYQSFLETARENRHDLRHHNALLLERLESGDTEGAKAYLRTHEQAMAEATLTQFCQNVAANAVLRLYEWRTREEHVVFSAAAEIPEELPLSGPEVGSLLGNLLENALEACKRSADPEPCISFSARVEDDSLLLEMRNTVEGKTEFRDGLPLSTKPGGGIGTRSISATVQRHGEILCFSQHGSEFFTQMVLPL